mgnify:FL=1
MEPFPPPFVRGKEGEEGRSRLNAWNPPFSTPQSHKTKRVMQGTIEGLLLGGMEAPRIIASQVVMPFAAGGETQTEH